MSKFFVTGTDTEVGKTFASCVLLEAARNQGLSTLALKPVAAGCEDHGDGIRNEDAVALQKHMSKTLPYEQVNPVTLRAPTSPHIAAQLDGKQVSVSRLLGFCRGALMTRPDFALVEGAGGWRVPISPRETLADLAKQLEYPVILVVNLKLGCLNHAMLTAEAIRRDGLKIAGWVANHTTDQVMAHEEAYITSIQSGLAAPLIANLRFSTDCRPEDLAGCVNLACLDL